MVIDGNGYRVGGVWMDGVCSGCGFCEDGVGDRPETTEVNMCVHRYLIKKGP